MRPARAWGPQRRPPPPCRGNTGRSCNPFPDGHRVISEPLWSAWPVGAPSANAPAGHEGSQRWPRFPGVLLRRQISAGPGQRPRRRSPGCQTQRLAGANPMDDATPLLRDADAGRGSAAPRSSPASARRSPHGRVWRARAWTTAPVWASLRRLGRSRPRPGARPPGGPARACGRPGWAPAPRMALRGSTGPASRNRRRLRDRGPCLRPAGDPSPTVPAS